MTVLSSHRSVAGPARRAGWTPARIISAVAGVLLGLCSLGLLGAGGVALWAGSTQRHGGEIGLGTWNYRSAGYAVASSTADLYGATGAAIAGLDRSRAAGRRGPRPGRGHGPDRRSRPPRCQPPHTCPRPMTDYRQGVTSMTAYQHDPARRAGQTAPAGNGVGVSLLALINACTRLCAITGQPGGGYQRGQFGYRGFCAEGTS